MLHRAFNDIYHARPGEFRELAIWDTKRIRLSREAIYKTPRRGPAETDAANCVSVCVAKLNGEDNGDDVLFTTARCGTMPPVGDR